MSQGRFAEVIGDPVDHSLSPLIHNFWLTSLGLPGEYRATEVKPDQLKAYLARRRSDPDWRGCSVTSPLKEEIAPLLDLLDDRARAIGAINCIRREGKALVGGNTDVNGIEAAIAHVPIEGRTAVIIGSGGAARAAGHFLLGRRVAAICLVTRDPERSRGWVDSGDGQEGRIQFVSQSEACTAMTDALLVINASPLGMESRPPVPHALLEGLRSMAAFGVAFDMIYRPAATPFLSSARRCGLDTIGGLTMLVGQARTAFRHFFGISPPRRKDGELLALLGQAIE